MSIGEFILAEMWTLIGMIVCLAGSALFSGSETALFSLSAADLLKFAERGDRLGHVVNGLMRQPRRLLMVILLGNQLVNVAFFAISTGLMIALGDVEGVRPWRPWLLPAPLVAVVLLGEVLPKNLAISQPAGFARITGVPLAVLTRLLGPVARAFSDWLIDPLTRLFAPARMVHATLTGEELAELLSLSSRRGVIDAKETAWLQEVIHLGRRKVAEIMVPRVDVVAYDVDAPPAGLVERFRETGLVKIPVYEGDLDGVVGVIYAKELLLTGSKPLRSLVRPVPFVPETGTVDKLLHQFRVNRTQMAMVVDEYGGIAGLVTLEDALEEVVGDIAYKDEDVAAPVREVGPDEYLIDGSLPVRDWPDVFDIDLRAEHICTIGGVVMQLLDRLPRVGDTARTGNLAFTVEAMRGRRISTVRLRMTDGEVSS